MDKIETPVVLWHTEFLHGHKITVDSNGVMWIDANLYGIDDGEEVWEPLWEYINNHSEDPY